MTRQRSYCSTSSIEPCRKNSKCSSKKYCNDYRLINKLINCPGNQVCCDKKIKTYCAICPPRCDYCSSSTSLHLVSASSDKCCYPHKFQQACCGFVNPCCDNCPIRPAKSVSLSSSCFGSLSSSSSSSRSSCCRAPAPKPCFSCPSEKPCCSSCKYCRIQKCFKDGRDCGIPHPDYEYVLTMTSGKCSRKSTCCKDKKKKCCGNVYKCKDKCKDKKKCGKKCQGKCKDNSKRYCEEDYKKKVEKDKKKEGILVEVKGNCYCVDGEKRKTLKLKRGQTYKFNVVQESKDGLYRHHLVFTTESKGGHKVRGKQVCPTAMKNAPKPCAYGTVKLVIDKKCPCEFYYQDMNNPNMGGKVIVE